MPRRPTPLAALLVGNAALAAALAATYPSRLGAARWHDDVAYVTLIFAAVAAVPLLRRRRETTLLMASFGAWSIATGLFLVYLTPYAGRARWMAWWHGATSVAFLLAFLAHWTRNHPRLVGLASRLPRRPAVLAVAAGGAALLALAVAASLATEARVLLQERYLAALCALALAATAALLLAAGLAATSRRGRRCLDDDAFRAPLRGALDAWLLGATWLAALSGFPLLYLSRPLRALDAYWPLVAWHALVSVLLLGLVVAHATLNRRPLRAHAGLARRRPS